MTPAQTASGGQVSDAGYLVVDDGGFFRRNRYLVRIDPINGPGVCGANYPLRVSGLGAFCTQ